MTFNPELHHRQSFRLKNYDYSQNGAYFITACTQDNIALFGEIKALVGAGSKPALVMGFKPALITNYKPLFEKFKTANAYKSYFNNSKKIFDDLLFLFSILCYNLFQTNIYTN